MDEAQGPRSIEAIRQTLKALTPPVLWRALGGGRSSADRAETAPVAPMAIPETGPKPLRFVAGAPVFDVPMERVRYPDGRRYVAGEHHFMQYYIEGLPALQRFYEEHVPDTIFDKYFLDVPSSDAPPTVLTPWLADAVPRPPRGEGGLGPEHGVQEHGPVSEQKTLLEAQRLDDVYASIAERGFVPELGGYVQGYFMISDSSDWVFVVRGGFHRTAAMAHLGFDTLPAQFYPHYPRVVEATDVGHWPLVADGSLSEDEALEIFGQFFRSPIYELPS